ncbi:MAG: hypothetical protein FWH55_14065 [Oscillospiraceae bacterium]|nr:hypothetical protein [Oscillospiraceae bacterium]
MSVQQVRPPDGREGRQFDWISESGTIQIVSEKSLLTFQLDADNQFRFVSRCPKPE